MHRHLLVKFLGAAVVVLLIAPFVVLIGVSLNAGNSLVFPPHGLSLRWYFNIANRDGIGAGVSLSIWLACVSTVASLVVGLPASVAIARHEFRGRNQVLLLLMSPLIVPQVVTGMGFLVTLSLLGIFDSIPGLLLLHWVLTFPITVRVLVSALVRMKRSLEEVAQSLGATPLRAFFEVGLPTVMPGVVAASVFAFVTSFENFTSSQFLTWNRQTLPVVLYGYIQTENDPTAAAVSSLLVLVVAVSVFALTKIVSIDNFTKG